MFIQHVQYTITGGVAYVSDFQGIVLDPSTIRLGSLPSLPGVDIYLTDPQILTSPYACCCFTLEKSLTYLLDNLGTTSSAMGI
jgi:hypothetical protein